ncbi:hypothetical protein [Caballeronia sp. TF1N1]|uniref:hypothetical protein n=1 Tax=Caballeronia sp. TF1N1 TaxID=2878153 RepID=UPI001FD4D711|nr:hypothetical protein [Caballeronia sp. TF1N1]
MGQVIPIRPAVAVKRSNHLKTVIAHARRATLPAICFLVILILRLMRRPLRFLSALVAIPALVALPVIAFGWSGLHKAAFLAAAGLTALSACMVPELCDALLRRLEAVVKRTEDLSCPEKRVM